MATQTPPVDQGQDQEQDIWKNINPKDVLLDPGFHAQNEKVRRYILKQITPEWDSISKEDQDATVNAPEDYWKEYFAPKEPAKKPWYEKALDVGKSVVDTVVEGQVRNQEAQQQTRAMMRGEKVELPPDFTKPPDIEAILESKKAPRKVEGLLKPGKISLYNDMKSGNPYSAITVQLPQGATIIPNYDAETMSPMSTEDAIAQYQRTGIDYGVFRSMDEAEKYVDQIVKDKESGVERRMESAEKFDPEGSGYDYEGAVAAGLGPDESGHWPSRDPNTGMILKGVKHPSWDRTAEAEGKLGNWIGKRDDGRYYSVPGKEHRESLGIDPKDKLDAAPIAIPYTDKDGKTVLLLGKNQGRVLDSRSALDLYEKTNYNYGKFDTPEEAAQYAAWLSSQPEEIQKNALDIARNAAVDRGPTGLEGASIQFREPTKKGIGDFLDEKMDLGEIMKLLPFLGSITEIGELFQVYQAAQRLNESDPRKWYDGRGWDEQVLQEYQDKLLEDAIRGSTRWYDILNVGAQIPGFALEFAATGGAFSGSKKTVEETITKALGRLAKKRIGSFTAKAIGATAGGVAQTAAMPQLVARETLSRMVPQAQVEKLDDDTVRVMFEPGEDFLDALAKGLPSAFVEVASERTGELIPMLGKTLKETKAAQYLSKLPVAQKMAAIKAAIARRWLMLNPKKGMQDFLAKIKEKAAWNGVLGEIFEERVGDVARDVFGVTDPEEWSATTRLATGIQAQPGSTAWEVRKQAMLEMGDQMLTEAAAFALPGAIGKLLSYRPNRKSGTDAAIRTLTNEVSAEDLDKGIQQLDAENEARRRAAGETSTELPQELPGPEAAQQPKKLPGEPTERQVDEFNFKIKELADGKRQAVFIPRGARAIDRKTAIANAPAKSKVFWSVNGAIIYDPDKLSPENIIQMLEQDKTGELFGRITQPDIPTELPAEPGAEAAPSPEQGIAEPGDQISPEEPEVYPTAPPARTETNPFDWTNKIPQGEEMIGKFVLTPYGAGTIMEDEKGEDAPEGTVSVGLGGGQFIRMRTDNVMLLDSDSTDFNENDYKFRTPESLQINPESEYAGMDPGPLYEQMRADAMNSLFGILRAEHREEGEGLPGSRYDNITFNQQVYARAIQEISDTFGESMAKRTEAAIAGMANRAIGKPVATRSPHEIEGLPEGVSFDGVDYGEGGKTITGFRYTDHNMKSPALQPGENVVTVQPGESLSQKLSESRKRFDAAEKLRQQFIEGGASSRITLPTDYNGRLSQVLTRDMSVSGPVKALLDRKISQAEKMGIDNEIVLSFIQGKARDEIVDEIMQSLPEGSEATKDQVRGMVNAIKQINMIPESSDKAFPAWQNRARDQVRQDLERFTSLPGEMPGSPLETPTENAPLVESQKPEQKKHEGPLTDLFEDDQALVNDPSKFGVVTMLRRQLARAVETGSASDSMLGFISGKSVDEIADELILKHKAMAEMQPTQVKAIVRALKQLKGIPNTGTAEFDAWQQTAMDKMAGWVRPESETDATGSAPPGVTDIPTDLPEDPVVPKSEAEEEEYAGPTAFVSGLQRSPSDIDLQNANDRKAAIGVAVGEGLSKNVVSRLISHVKGGGFLFLDSGAFTDFKKGRETDWDNVTGTYSEIIDSLDENERKRVWMVAPDVVGNQEDTLKLQQVFFNPTPSSPAPRREVKGTNVIIPIQRGDKSLYEIASFLHDQWYSSLHDTTQPEEIPEGELRIIDLPHADDTVWGIPYNAEAYTADEVIAFVRAAKDNPITITGDLRIHLLGAGPKKVNELKKYLDDIGLGGVTITGDSAPRDRARKILAPTLPTEMTANVEEINGHVISRNTGKEPDRRQKRLPMEGKERRGADRRIDAELRQEIADMPRADLEENLLIDNLTGLYTKFAWEHTRLRKFVASIDFDKVKRINDTYGHGQGDVYFKRGGDGFLTLSLPVYRVGGDEFWVTADSKAEIDDAMARAKAWFAENPVEVKDEAGEKESLQVGFSYGIAPSNGNREQTMKAADAEMYKNKKAGVDSGEIEGRPGDNEKSKTKVVDAEGKPLIVYHGSSATFDKFRSDNNIFYFTDDPMEAAEYGVNVIRATLDIKNPYISEEDVEADSQRGIALVNRLRSEGYDGIIQPGKYGGKYYIAFDPNQISINHDAPSGLSLVPISEASQLFSAMSALDKRKSQIIFIPQSVMERDKETTQMQTFNQWVYRNANIGRANIEGSGSYFYLTPGITEEDIKAWDAQQKKAQEEKDKNVEPEPTPGQPPAAPTSDAAKKALENLRKKLGQRGTMSMAIEGSVGGPSKEELQQDPEVFDNLVILGDEFYKAGIIDKAEWHSGMHAAAEDLARGFGNDVEPLFPLIWSSITGEEDYAGGIGGVYGATAQGEPAGPETGGMQAPGGETGGAPGGIQPGPTEGAGGVGAEGAIPGAEGAGGEGGVPGGEEVGAAGAGGGGATESGPLSGTRDLPRDTNRFFAITKEVGFGEGGWKGKLSRNMEAIRVLMDLRRENRYPTEDEKRRMARFIGWGGLWQVLDYGHSKYKEERSELRHLLSEEEWDRARASTQNAHYTAEPIARALWRMVDQLGYKGNGTVLEGATGSGIFLGTADDDVANTSQFIGTELDPITAEIAQHLYPAAKIMARGFQTLEFPDNTIDLAISNVPFGGKIFDKRYATLKPAIHDYYFLKTVDKLRPGGILVYITSTYTMDKRSDRVRRMLDDKADLVSAFRMPNGTFMNNAGTGVATDIIILRKRMPGEVREETTWGQNKWMDAPLTEVPDLMTVGDTAKVSMNEYFIMNPDHVLGTMARGRGLRSNNDPIVVPPKDIQDDHLTLVDWVASKLNTLSYGLPREAYQEQTEAPEPKPMNFVERFADDNVWENQIIVHPETGVLVRRNGSLLEPLEQTILSQPNAEQAIKDLISVRDRLWNVFRVQIESNNDELLKSAQEDLGTAYDRFVAVHGYINSRYVKGLFWNDPTYYFLAGLEEADHDNGSVSKSPIFTERSMRPHMPIDTLPEDRNAALLMIYANRGYIDLKLMASLSDKSADEWEAELRDEGLVFKNPVTGRLELPEEYLSGDIYDKIEEASKAIPLDPTYEINLDALQAAKPEHIPIDSEDVNKRFEVKVGSSWIKDSHYIGFIQHLLEDEFLSVDITRTEKKNEYRISYDGYVSPTILFQKWGTRYKDAMTLLQLAMNHKRPIVKIKDSDGVPRKSEKDTLEAQLVQTKIKEEFSRWARKSPFAEEMEEEYNSRYNRVRLREYNGSHLTFDGMNRAILRSNELEPHQQNAVWRIIQEGKAMLAHFVGSGKTFVMAASAMESRRMGLVKKPMIAVPKQVYRQVGGDFARLYPGAKLLIVDEKDFTPENRKKLFAKIAMEDWDAIILSHEQMGSIPMSPSRMSRFIAEQIEELEEAINNMGPQHTKTGKANLKKMQKRLDDYKAKLESLLNMRQDDTIYFDNMGVDMLMVDEAHRFKSLPVTTSQGGVAGLDTAGSKRATALKVKTDFLLEKYNDRGVVFATGTPVSNSMVELYNFDRYMDPKGLRNAGIGSFDEWAANFCNIVTIYGTRADGRSYGPQNVFGEFTNLADLQQMFRKYADVVNRESMEFPVPKVTVDPETGGEYTLIKLEPDEWTDKYFDSILERMEFLKKNPGFDKRIDNLLKINNDARMASIDGRLVSGEAPDDPLSKANQAVRMLTDFWEKGNDKRTTQVVFVDRFQNAETGFNLYEDMKNKLLRNGIPESEVAVIHDYNNPEKLRQLYRDMRHGKVRILLTTAKTSEGANIQTRLGRLYHLSAPWTPKEMEQREGRIIRQGNLHYEWGQEVEVIQMATERTFDARIFEILRRKARFIRQYLKGDSNIRKASDPAAKVIINYEMISAIASGNPDYQIKVQLEAQYANYEVLYERYLNNKKQLQWRLDKTTQEIANTKTRIHAHKLYNEEFQKQREPFEVDLDGEKFTDPDAAIERIKKLQESGVPNPKLEEGKELEEGEPEIIPYEPKLNNRKLSIQEAIDKINYRAVPENRDFKFSAVIAGAKYDKVKDAEEAVGKLAKPYLEIKGKHHVFALKIYGFEVKLTLEWNETREGHIPVIEYMNVARALINADDSVVQKVVHDLHDLKRVIASLEKQLEPIIEEVDKIKAQMEVPFEDLEPMMSVKRELNEVNARLGLASVDDEGEIEDEGADDDDDADPAEGEDDFDDGVYRDGVYRDMPADPESWAMEDKLFDLLQPYREINIPGSEPRGSTAKPAVSPEQAILGLPEEKRQEYLNDGINELREKKIPLDEVDAYLILSVPVSSRYEAKDPFIKGGESAVKSLADLEDRIGKDRYQDIEDFLSRRDAFRVLRSSKLIKVPGSKEKDQGARVPKPEIEAMPALPRETEGGPEFLYTRQMTLEIAEALDDENVPQEIIDELRAKGNPLGTIQRVSKMKDKNGWEISDGVFIIQLFQNSENPDILEVYDALGYNRVEIPELMWMVEEITQNKIGMTGIRKILGHFVPDGKGGYIEIRRDLAYLLKDREHLARTLAHELGHAVDYAPDSIMNRGNLLGRLLSLRQFTRNMHPAVKGTNARVLKQELTALSDYWRPWDRATAPASYADYRAQPEELYADFISAVLLSPGTAYRLAPKMYQEFHKHLDTKPNVKETYFKVRLMLMGSKEDILNHRLERLGVVFRKAEAVNLALMTGKVGRKHGWFSSVRTQFDDMRWEIKKRVYTMMKSGAYAPVEDHNPLYLWDELSTKIRTDTYKHYKTVMEQVYEPLRKAGMKQSDLDTFFTLNRAAKERMNMFNPVVGTGEYAIETIEQFKRVMGKERYAILEKCARTYADLRWPLILAARDSGLYSFDIVEKVFLPNKYSYAKFTPVEYLRTHASTAVMEQCGFAGDIGSPFGETLKLDEALIRMTARNNAVRASLGFLDQFYKDDIRDAVRVNMGKKEPARYKSPHVGFDIVQVMVDGKAVGFEVDKYLAESFNNISPERLDSISKVANYFQRKWFWKVVILYNLGFGGWSNPIRDIKRNFRLLPLKGAIVGDLFQLLSSYATAAPHAFKWLWGNKHSDQLVGEMIDSYSFSMPLPDLMMDEHDSFTVALMKAGVISADGSMNKSKAVKYVYKTAHLLGAPLRFMMEFTEMTGKLAGYQIRKEAGEAGKELGFKMRNFTSTPNYDVKGKYQNITNSWFIFSTIMKEGWKSEYMAATDPKTRAGYWWRTQKLLFLKAIQVAAELGALSFLFGDDLAKKYDAATEYMKNNFLLIPFSEPDENGRVTFLQLPQDEMTRLLGGVLRYIMLSMKDESPAEFEDFMKFIAAQLTPSLNPMVSTIGGWMDFLTGANFLDDFRQTPVFSDDVWNARGPERWKKMVQWTMNNNGISGFTTWDDFRQTRYQVWTQYDPLIGRFVGRMFKTTNYGLTEKMKHEQERVTKREDARSRLARKNSTQLVSGFYAIKYDVDRQSLMRQEKLSKGGSPAELANEYPLAIHRKAFNKTDTVLRKIQTRIDEIQEDPNKNDRQKLLETVKLKQQMDAIAKKTLIDTGMAGAGQKDLPDDFMPAPDIFSEE